MSETIVEAAPLDAEAILSLQKRAYQSEAEIYNDYNIPPLVQTLEELEAEFTDHVFLKTNVSGALVGSVRAQRIDSVCHIERLIVEPHCQGKGVGTRLMRAIEARFSDVSRFELFTGHKSEKNLGLYQHLGYVEARREEIAPGLNFVFLSKCNRPVGA